MARPKSPGGKSNTVCTRLSDAELHAFDEARGQMSASEWLRLTVLAAIERAKPPTGSVDHEAEAVKQNHAARGGDCPHPKARVNKGLCGACGTNVGMKQGGQ